MSTSTTQKPTTRRIVGMVVALSLLVWASPSSSSPISQRLHQRAEYAPCRAAGHLAGRAERRHQHPLLCAGILVRAQVHRLGTFVNGIGMGFIITFFYEPIAAAFGPAASLPEQLVWVVLAVLVTALGASLYQTADLGIAPYDYLSLGLRDYTHFQYFGCRVFTDAFCALLCWLLGGLVGLGTLICAFCLGPFIQFFNGLVSERVLQYKPEKA